MKISNSILIVGSGGLLGSNWLSYLLENSDVKIIGTKLVNEKSQKTNFKDKFKDRFKEFDLNVLDEDFQSKLKRIIVEFDIRGVVYNVGIDSPPTTKKKTSFSKFPCEDFDLTFQTNSTGLFKVAQVLDHAWTNLNGGSLVCIGSIYSKFSPDQRYYEDLPGEGVFHKSPAYGSSKSANVALVKYLATLWGSKNIRVNVVSPGGVFSNQDQSFLIKYVNRVPMRRMADAKKDIAPLICFLLSDESSYITGQDIFVDGGYGCW